MDISEKKDIMLPEAKPGDRLHLMFAKQAEAEKQFAIVEGFPERLVFGKLENLQHPETCKHINDNILWRLVQEVVEATIALKNAKTWRQSKYMTDIHEFLDEVGDIQIYIMNLCMAAGIDPDLLTQIVLKKIEVNKDRIKSKY